MVYIPKGKPGTSGHYDSVVPYVEEPLDSEQELRANIEVRSPVQSARRG